MNLTYRAKLLGLKKQHLVTLFERNELCQTQRCYHILAAPKIETSDLYVQNALAFPLFVNSTYDPIAHSQCALKRGKRDSR